VLLPASSAAVRAAKAAPMEAAAGASGPSLTLAYSMRRQATRRTDDAGQASLLGCAYELDLRMAVERIEHSAQTRAVVQNEVVVQQPGVLAGHARDPCLPAV